jgi:hypothetical protein
MGAMTTAAANWELSGLAVMIAQEHDHRRDDHQYQDISTTE